MRTTINAIETGMHTLVYYGGKDFPLPRGNCFSVKAENGKYYRIVNFGFENLQHLCKEKGLTWPIKISCIGPEHAVINDERIGERWYQSEFCTTCTPHDLLPLPQQLKEYRCEARGGRRTIKGDDFDIVCIPANPPKPLIP